jgi:hypothetical protein
MGIRSIKWSPQTISRFTPTTIGGVGDEIGEKAMDKFLRYLLEFPKFFS